MNVDQTLGIRAKNWNVAIPHIVGAGLLTLDVVTQRGSTRTLARAGGTCGNVLSIMASLGWRASALNGFRPSKAATIAINDMAASGVNVPRPDYKYPNLPVIKEFLGTAGHSFGFTCDICGQRQTLFDRDHPALISDWKARVRTATLVFVDRLSAEVMTVARYAHKLGLTIVYEPSDPDDITWCPEMLKLASIVKYSDCRAQKFSGMLDPASCLEIKTLGEKGVQWRHKQEFVSEWQTLRTPCTSITIKDTCGAGDWLTAGFLAVIQASKEAGNECVPIEQCLESAQKLAAWSCGFIGARGGQYDDPAGPRKALDILSLNNPSTTWLTPRVRQTKESTSVQPIPCCL